MYGRQNVSGEHRLFHSLSKGRTLVGLFGAPAAWVVQMALSHPLAAYACYPHQIPLPAPLWPALPAILAIISLVCLAGGIFSGYVAWDSWRGLGRPLEDGANKKHVIEADEGQTRFLVMLGMMSSFVFIVAVLFNTFAILLVRPCSAWI
ncbi:MAG TPA: hypothetical protein VJM47_04525 [Nitrosospira sp.]|jgi:hypothetical protein|nr:hypothetical protein [Nitrosospira sp.]